jgi:hypothetical protein
MRLFPLKKKKTHPFLRIAPLDTRYCNLQKAEPPAIQIGREEDNQGRVPIFTNRNTCVIVSDIRRSFHPVFLIRRQLDLNIEAKGNHFL